MWIAIVAFALIGIVTLQLGLLELNTGIGRALEREALLQRQNAALSIENSELAGGDRVESQASRLGMELVPSGALRFLAAHPEVDAVHAAAALSAPTKSTSGDSSESASSASGASATSEMAASETSGTATSGSSPSQSQQASASEPPTATGESGSPATGVQSSSPPEAPTPTQQPPSTSSSPQVAAGNASTEASPAGGTVAGPTG